MEYPEHIQEKLAELMLQMRQQEMSEEQRQQVSNLMIADQQLPTKLQPWRQRYVAIAQATT